MLTINRLDRSDRSALVAQIAGRKTLADEVVDQIVDRTDGVLLFIEELTKSVLESGVPLVGIPTSLHDSLMARLDRLASVRLVAQIGAAIGRQFPYGLLRAISDLPEDELRAALGRLVASELVFQRGTPPDAVYNFKHALVQDAAHGSLLRGTRQQLHAQIAEALETHSPELMDSQPELFAQHYAEAGLVEKSAAYWGKAGHRSAARSALVEAAAQFHKGLDQLALLPDGPERQLEELEFSSALGAALIAPSRASLHRKRAGRMPAQTYYGSGSVRPRSSFRFLLGSRSIMCSAANSIWRSLTLRSCCVLAICVTIPPGWFWVTPPSFEPCG
jgi:predicted ATPase